MDWIRNNKKAKKGFAALKLDMSKAYDRFEWSFLQAVMLNMGFAESWVSLIMRCVKSVSYAFRINHSIIGTLLPQKGLWQGDPLSPYLFVLCAQGLSSIISDAVKHRLFKGVQIARSSHVISHLFFANDSLIFFRPTKEDCLQLGHCLKIYQNVSGQMINYEKSAFTFSPSRDGQTIDDIKRVLSVEVVMGHELYLGLPTFSLGNKSIQFAYMRECICN